MWFEASCFRQEKDELRESLSAGLPKGSKKMVSKIVDCSERDFRSRPMTLGTAHQTVYIFAGLVAASLRHVMNCLMEVS